LRKTHIALGSRRLLSERPKTPQQELNMISVICVYNNERIFSGVLGKSLRNQTADFQLIAVDNSRGEFESAAKALNDAGKRAKGEFLMFVHQDVAFRENDWLAVAEKTLGNLQSLGVAGCCGMDESGKKQGFIRDRFHYWGSPLSEPRKVQTLDECVLIVPKAVFQEVQFDEQAFKGWHCYGADYCLSIGYLGLESYAIPMYIHHNSPSSNMSGFKEERYALFQKHRKMQRTIHTTGGSISDLRITVEPWIEAARATYVRFFPQFLSYVSGTIRRELADSESILDIGWERDFPILSIMGESEHRSRLVSLEYEALDGIRERHSYDAVVALDVMEHLTKANGSEFIKKMETLARRKIVLLCPNNVLWNRCARNQSPQAPGWKCQELEEMGFEVYGANGSKSLMNPYGQYVQEPEMFWHLVSDLTQRVVRDMSEYAFELLGIKELNSER
jgi:hypothetical protein